MLSWFENLVDPYPAEPPKAPPKGFWAFLWAGTQGMRRYLLGCMTGVVTDDDDDARAATEAAQAARREVHRAVAEDAVPRISETQTKRLHALCGDLALDRDKKLAIATWSAGREITTTSDLTTREASALIDYLAGRLADQKKEGAA